MIMKRYSKFWPKDPSGRVLFVYATLISLFIISIQTYRSKFAFFYGDDFMLISRSESAWTYIFQNHNGHYLPIVKGVYEVLFSVFGLTSYIPYLLTSAILNLFLSMAVAIYLIRSSYAKSVVLFVPSLVLVIPFSAHTIFWGLAALNFVPLALLLLYMTVDSRRSRSILTVILTLVGLGFGGYGLVLIFGILFSNFFKKQKDVFIASLLLNIFTGLLYLNQRDSSEAQSTMDFHVWFFQNFQLLIKLFTPGLTAGYLPATLFQVIMYVAIILLARDLLSGIFSKRQFQMHNELTLACTLAAFTIVIWISRKGVETILASRYVILGFTLCLLVFIRLPHLLEPNPKINPKNRPFQAYFTLLLVATALLRVPSWLQSPLDINYQSQINKEIVVAELCNGSQSEKDWSRISQIDGLMNLEYSLSSPLWEDFKKLNC